MVGFIKLFNEYVLALETSKIFNCSDQNGNGLILEIKPAGTYEMLLLNIARTRWPQSWSQIHQYKHSLNTLKIQKKN